MPSMKEGHTGVGRVPALLQKVLRCGVRFTVPLCVKVLCPFARGSRAGDALEGAVEREAAQRLVLAFPVSYLEQLGYVSMRLLCEGTYLHDVQVQVAAPHAHGAI